jgi:cytochrome c oxidase assembly protein subunit 15
MLATRCRGASGENPDAHRGRLSTLGPGRFGRRRQLRARRAAAGRRRAVEATVRSVARWLAAPAALGMFVVLVMGAAVTNTGSAEGCGRSWPLCDGRFVPELAAAALIEYSHRAVTGAEGLLIAALAVTTWLGWPGNGRLRALIALMVGTLLLQAGMGAWAVLYPQTPAVLATHFGISLLCLASTVLVAASVRADAIERPAAPPGYARAAAGLVVFTLVVGYVGAYARHTNAQLACIDWPLCNGVLFPGFAGPVGVVFAHRLSALVLLAGVAALAVWSKRFREERPDLHRAGLAALWLGVAQAASGALVVFTRMTLFSALAHAALVSLFFAALTYAWVGALPAARAAAAPAPAPRPSELPG